MLARTPVTQPHVLLVAAISGIKQQQMVSQMAGHAGIEAQPCGVVQRTWVGQTVSLLAVKGGFHAQSPLVECERIVSFGEISVEFEVSTAGIGRDIRQIKLRKPHGTPPDVAMFALCILDTTRQSAAFRRIIFAISPGTIVC